MEATLWSTKGDAQNIFKQLIFSQVTRLNPLPPPLLSANLTACSAKKKTKKNFKDEATDEIEIGIKGFFFNEMALKRHETLEKLLP